MHFLSRFTLTLALVFTLATSASALILDDFNDGNADGWFESSFFPADPGAVDFSVSTVVADGGRYHFSTGGVNGFAINDFMASLNLDSLTPGEFTDSSLSLDLEMGTNGGAGVFMRSDANLSGYAFILNDHLDAMSIFVSDGVINTTLAAITVPGGLTAGTNYTIRTQAIGDRLDFKVWESILPEPAGWMLTAYDSTLPEGGFGLAASYGDSHFPGPIEASFDNVTFSPEPGTGMLVSMGLIGLSALGRRKEL